MGYYLHVDIRPRLRVANFYLLGLQSSESARVDVSENSVIVTSNHAGERSVIRTIKCDNVQFRPNSCSNMQHLTNGVSFRLQTEPICDELNSPSKTTTIQSKIVYKAQCVFCGSALLYENVAFDRVLPLPSADAISESGSWFCCQHVDPIASATRFQPKEKDCFLGEDFVCVNSRVIDLTRVRVIGNQRVICNRCLSIAGEIAFSGSDDLSVFRLYNQAVVFVASNVPILKTKDHLSNVLKSTLLKCHENFTSKVCLLSVDSRMSILIWLTDTGILHLCSVVNDDNRNETCTPRSAIKVLYCIEDTESCLSKQWQNDATVENLRLNKEFQLSIASLLVSNTKQLPNLLKKLDSFWVAYV